MSCEDAPPPPAYIAGMDIERSLAGQLLLALPGIGDPRFDQAVIAICAHDELGALGVDFGRVIEGLGMHELLRQFDIAPGDLPDGPVHLGGPVEPQRGFVVHSTDWMGDETLKVGDHWGLTGTIDILRAIAGGEGPARWQVALGYAGWGAGQLDREFARHGWLSVPARDSLLFEGDARGRWTAALRAQGIDPRMLAAESGHA